MEKKVNYLFVLSNGIPIFFGPTFHLLNAIIPTNVIAYEIIYETSLGTLLDIVNCSNTFVKNAKPIEIIINNGILHDPAIKIANDKNPYPDTFPRNCPPRLYIYNAPANPANNPERDTATH